MIQIKNLETMDRLAGRLAKIAGLNPRVVYLRGPLGVGKTTLVRYWLRHLGIEGRIRSPTFTILECYEREDAMLVHADLFRIGGAGELLNTGLLDFWGSALLLIEWPERGGAATPPADWEIKITFGAEGEERRLVFS
jgi:tRNA threonylcarbamoyladenosine biosynthesis protein TsaE